MVLGSLLLVLPSIWISTFSRLTSISLSGVTGSALIVSVMVCAYSVDPSSAMVAQGGVGEHKGVEWAMLPISAGMFFSSLSGEREGQKWQKGRKVER